MLNLSDMRYVVPLTAEEVVPEEDMIPVFHPAGVMNVERSLSLAALSAALGSGGSLPASGVSQADFDEFKLNVIADLNNLRDAIMFTQASLDNDAGVATDTFVANGSPPPLVSE